MEDVKKKKNDFRMTLTEDNFVLYLETWIKSNNKNK